MSYASSIINKLVDQNLNDFDSTKVFYLNVCNLTRKYIIEYYKPNNYVSVTVREVLGGVDGKEVYSKLMLYACHDSCWRQDGTESALRDIKAQSLASLSGKVFGTKSVFEHEYMKCRRNVKYERVNYDFEVAEQDLEHQLQAPPSRNNQELAASLISELVKQSLPNLDDNKVLVIKANDHCIEYYKHDENGIAILLRKFKDYVDCKEKYGKPKVYLLDDLSKQQEETKSILEKIDASYFPCFCREPLSIRTVNPVEYRRYISNESKRRSLVSKANNDLITL